jgi:hypothetical protein
MGGATEKARLFRRFGPRPCQTTRIQAFVFPQCPSYETMYRTKDTVYILIVVGPGSQTARLATIEAPPSL